MVINSFGCSVKNNGGKSWIYLTCCLLMLVSLSDIFVCVQSLKRRYRYKLVANTIIQFLFFTRL